MASKKKSSRVKALVPPPEGEKPTKRVKTSPPPEGEKPTKRVKARVGPTDQPVVRQVNPNPPADAGSRKES